jgi:hypothetical protein
MARNKIGHGHDGRMNALARPGEASHDVHHTPAIARGMEPQQHTNATLGKPGKAKGYAVPPHPGPPGFARSARRLPCLSP